MKRVVILVALVAILAGGGGAGWWFFLREPPAEDAAAAEPDPVPLNSERTLELKPFVLPILREGQVTEHLTLVLRLEFAEPRDRNELKKIRTPLRDALFRELHGMLAFRHVYEQDEVLPVMRERLKKAGDEVLGPGAVAAVLVQALSRRAPDEG